MYIFFIKKNIFSNLHGNPKLKLYVLSPKIVVNKCVVPNISIGYKTGPKKASFHFHEDQDLK